MPSQSTTPGPNEDDFDDELPEFHEVLKDSGMQPVSGQELRRATGTERDEWFTALANELAYFSEKAVFETMPPQERRTVKQSEILPMKIGWDQTSEAGGPAEEEA